MPDLDGASTRLDRRSARPSTLGRIDVSTPVVVLGAQAHGPLGIFRSLGRLGVAVHAIDPEPRAAPSSSRYLRTRTVCDLTSPTPEVIIEKLQRVADRLGKPAVLIPTADQTALLVDEHRDLLEGRYLLPHQPAGLAASLADKRRMAALAMTHHVPTPSLVVPQGLEDVRSYAASATFPVMLKGIDGARLKARTGHRMVIVERASELVPLYERMEDPADPNLLLQEYIPGGDDDVWMFNGYFDAASDCLIGITGRKIRQTPIHTGATSLGVCVPNQEVHDTTVRWMRSLGYRGILDIGYRYDARDGQYKVLDVNPRIGATFRLFVAGNGMDVARASYLDLTGQPVPTAEAVPGRRWINEGADLVSSIRYRREGSLRFRDWLTSLRGVNESAYFARDDLRPFARMLTGFMAR